MAEIFERKGLDAQAADWWRCAAHLGDPDALEYVPVFIDPDRRELITERDESAPDVENSHQSNTRGCQYSATGGALAATVPVQST
jgi:TPR repeat protein